MTNFLRRGGTGNTPRGRGSGRGGFGPAPRGGFGPAPRGGFGQAPYSSGPPSFGSQPNHAGMGRGRGIPSHGLSNPWEAAASSQSGPRGGAFSPSQAGIGPTRNDSRVASPTTTPPTFGSSPSTIASPTVSAQSGFGLALQSSAIIASGSAQPSTTGRMATSSPLPTSTVIATQNTRYDGRWISHLDAASVFDATEEFSSFERSRNRGFNEPVMPKEIFESGLYVSSGNGEISFEEYRLREYNGRASAIICSEVRPYWISRCLDRAYSRGAPEMEPEL